MHTISTSEASQPYYKYLLETCLKQIQWTRDPALIRGILWPEDSKSRPPPPARPLGAWAHGTHMAPWKLTTKLTSHEPGPGAWAHGTHMAPIWLRQIINEYSITEHMKYITLIPLKGHTNPYTGTSILDNTNTYKSVQIHTNQYEAIQIHIIFYKHQ